MNVLDVDTAALLDPGCALVVGSVSLDGRPHASRGWALRLLGGDPIRARVLVDAADEVALANLAPGRPVAVTAARVPTLRSVQVKGRSLGVEPADDEDRSLMADHVERFYTDIVETDHMPRETLDRFTPLDVVAVVIEVADAFDQTPGPAAGRPVGSPA